LGGVLGDEQDTVAECQRGGIHLWAGSLGALATLVPELRFLEQPYLFPSVAAFQGIRNALGNRNQAIRALFDRRGLVVLGMAFAGWRNISSVKKPIRAPADLAGMRVRSQPSDLHMEIWRSWRAQPKAIALTELDSALEIQLVDAFDVPATWVYATSLDARIKYHTLTCEWRSTRRPVFAS
jgi:TRAP-type C4-dicarboxylate transport system substrate-binding protein